MTVACALTPATSDDYAGANGLAIWTVLKNKADKLGVKFLIEHEEHGLVQNEDGAVLGLQVTDIANNKGLNFRGKQAVILASGGYKANTAMRLAWDPRLNADLSAGGLPHMDTQGNMTFKTMDAGAGTTDMSYVCEFRFKWGTKYYQYYDRT